ncbi:MAG: SUMF1/EgtB/PvdO family nonheme iron enzyme [Planctomycetota bacterium]|nr:SUMF1/EgtB/PvdO family nonheme iron enzyme [Planctomycetota bacterium]
MKRVMNIRCCGLFASIAVSVLTANVCFGAEAKPGEATPEKKAAVPAGPAYVLSCPQDDSLLSRPEASDDWKELHRQLDQRSKTLIKVVDRSKVDPKLFVESSGLRLYVESAKCQAFFNALPQDTGITLSWLVRDLLGRRYAVTGIEPEMIPVIGSAAKELGNEGMVLLKGGEYERSGHYFTSQSAELGERKGDKYKVKVPAIYVDKYKVTNAEYARFLNAGNPGYWNSTSWNQAITRNEGGGFDVTKGHERLPVVGVNFYQASGYATWAGKRLPTEAEWEFAAGGEKGRTYPWGNEIPDKTRGHFVGKEYAAVDAHPAGATPDGIFGMAGNAAEWCADFYDDSYYETAPEDGLLKNPTGPKEGLAKWQYRRMFKGFCRVAGSPEFLQCTKRHARPPLLTSAIGFRCVKPGCT